MRYHYQKILTGYSAQFQPVGFNVSASELEQQSELATETETEPESEQVSNNETESESDTGIVNSTEETATVLAVPDLFCPFPEAALLRSKACF